MLNIKTEIARLMGLTVTQLREAYEQVTGEPVNSGNRAFLIKRIVWRQQAAGQGGLTERARARAAEIARDQDLRMRPRPDVHAAFDLATNDCGKPADNNLPPTGSILTRVYRGRRLEVRVLKHGFEWEGKPYRSLTAVAKAVTGASWNGRLFFGLTTREAKT